MKIEKRVLIITGGSLDIDWAKRYLKKNKFDYVIAADSGLTYADQMKVNVDCILGDYDSVDSGLLEKYKNENDVKQERQIVTYPCEKNYTDTELAVHTALEHHATNITLLGAIGTRLDHTIGNIVVMKQAVDSGVECQMVNQNNRIVLANQEVNIRKSKQYGKYISLLPFGGEVIGITLTGFKYPLTEYTMKPGIGIGISNEVKDENAKINFKNGTLIVFETKD